jgi:hypothetical protein
MGVATEFQKKNIRVDSHFGFCMFLAHVLVRFSNFVGMKGWSKKTQDAIHQ